MNRLAKRLLGTGLVLAALGGAAVVGWRTFRGGAGSEKPAVAPVARYHCPMHPTYVSDRPGDCPICGMRLVPIERKTDGEKPASAVPPAGSTGKKVLYRSTMHPEEISDHPGKDSMGMEMERVEVEESGSGGPAAEGRAPVTIPTRKQQLIGVRTEVARRSRFIRTIRTVGRVAVDETRLRHVHTKVGGWIEELLVDATGAEVRRGQPLLRLYSPELLATQEEYLLALRTRGEMAKGALPESAGPAEALVESGRRRLLLYDLTPEQITELETTGRPSRTVTLHAEVSGFVLQRNVTQGERIESGTTLLDIADLSRVWVLASIYEYELPYVKTGQKATMTLSYLPARTFEGKVTLIYPILEESTRTVQVRLEFSNPDQALKPGMYSEVALSADLGERLAVPDSAVISSGTRNIVFVAQGEGYFEPREVQIGLRLPDQVEILDGLREGESVITAGNFFVDSESKLKAALESAAAPKASKER